MNHRCAILMNEKAGALHATATVEQVRKSAAEIGLEAEVVTTGSPDEMRRILREKVEAGVPRVAVAGGDGTVALAVQELAGSETALGIIPQGTANNFATALRLPMDLPSAVRVLLDGEVRRVDLGRIGDRYFTESAGVGLFADALALYGKSNKALGRALYAIGKVLFSMRAHRLRLTMDGEKHVERAVMCEAANTYRMGFAAPVAPGAKVTDGQLDVVIIGDLSGVGEVLEYYRAIRAQAHMSLPKVQCVRATEVRIDARRRLNVHADDQVVATTPVTIHAVPGALKVLIDRI